MPKDKKSRLKELDELLVNSRKLSTPEYVALLKEIQKNFTVHLAKNSLNGLMRDSAAITTALERLHYLIDSAETKGEKKADGALEVNVHFVPVN